MQVSIELTFLVHARLPVPFTLLVCGHNDVLYLLEYIKEMAKRCIICDEIVDLERIWTFPLCLFCFHINVVMPVAFGIQTLWI